MTIPLASPEPPATDIAQLKKVNNTHAQPAASTKHFAEDVNPALETSKWALEVCELCLVAHTPASDSIGLRN